MTGEPLVVEVVRSGFVESRHMARVVTLDSAGHRREAHGDVDVTMFARSAAKPLQAAAMLRHGLDLEGELLALATASHSGEAFHVDGVRKILAAAGLDDDALHCPEDLPLDPPTAHMLLQAQGGPSRVHMNCSGKHAAMLATCVVNDWPVDSYLDAQHPLQRAIGQTIEDLTGEPIAATGVDGCGTPIFGGSLAGVARAFRALVVAAPGTPERRVADAMRDHPEWTSGTTRPERALMMAIPGLLVKAGAEGVDAFAFRDGRAGAIKIEDGALRARVPVTVAMLRSLGLDDPALGELATPPVYGGGERVGEIRVSSGSGTAVWPRSRRTARS